MQWHECDCAEKTFAREGPTVCGSSIRVRAAVAMAFLDEDDNDDDEEKKERTTATTTIWPISSWSFTNDK
jgi:hypothetical protein